MSASRAAGLLPALALVFNAFTWGLSWYPLRLLQGAGVHALWATTLIYVVAVAVIVERGARPRVTEAGLPYLAAYELADLGLG